MTQIFDSEEINEACNNFDLLEYVSGQYELKNVGGRYYCCCPLHSENTPSMLVDGNRYHCFGCGASGNLLTWLVTVEKLPWTQATDKISKLTGCKITHLKPCEALNFYKEAKKLIEMPPIEEVVNREILPSSYMEQFSDEIPKEWLDEGISENTMRKFEVRIDHKANRIVYPVYDNNGQLIGVKGRTMLKSFKELGIAKYMNYKKTVISDFFEGMKYNKTIISSDKQIIIFEGLKSVMKLADYGDNHGVAAGTSYLNDQQVLILIKMGLKDVTIAFDSEVKLDKIKKCTQKLRRFTNVYAIYDKHHLLGEKESPVDRGKEIWQQLMKERVKI